MNPLENRFGVCRLEGNSSIPDWADCNEFCSITRTSEELSIVCPEENIPSRIICEKDWNVSRSKVLWISP
ncbi:hypothetical protein [Methanococcoides sp. FTZ1]|uniref:hypothetical protein n=1 Tax=Methanococcoides sp. FTZ1 TaxID=3439061 RepID=UPI003F85A033